jgi:hypothetical protein
MKIAKLPAYKLIQPGLCEILAKFSFGSYIKRLTTVYIRTVLFKNSLGN